VLHVEGLVAGYEPGLAIVDDVTFEAHEGEILALLGPNGAGKSTVVKAIAGLVPVHAGRIVVAGNDLVAMPAHARVRQGLAYVPQIENVFTTLSVRDNLRLGAALLPRAVRESRVEAGLALFPDLAERQRLTAGRLSGGQRQMLAVARALLLEPKVLLLDEPSAGLSPKMVDAVLGELVKIRGLGVATVLVEQNVRAALGIADRAHVLVDGRIRHAGRAVDLLGDPALGALYLGSAGRPGRDTVP